MLFSADEDITADVSVSYDFIKEILKKASDEKLYNDYHFLKIISEAFFNDDYFMVGDDGHSESCYIECFLSIFDRYLYYLHEEITNRFISRFIEEHPELKEEKEDEG